MIIINKLIGKIFIKIHFLMFLGFLVIFTAIHSIELSGENFNQSFYKMTIDIYYNFIKHLNIIMMISNIVFFCICFNKLHLSILYGLRFNSIKIILLPLILTIIISLGNFFALKPLSIMLHSKISTAYNVDKKISYYSKFYNLIEDNNRKIIFFSSEINKKTHESNNLDKKIYFTNISILEYENQKNDDIKQKPDIIISAESGDMLKDNEIELYNVRIINSNKIKHIKYDKKIFNIKINKREIISKSSKEDKKDINIYNAISILKIGSIKQKTIIYKEALQILTKEIFDFILTISTILICSIFIMQQGRNANLIKESLLSFISFLLLKNFTDFLFIFAFNSQILPLVLIFMINIIPTFIMIRWRKDWK